MLYFFCHIFFFFQAEDGIRDIGVTGVQTCALPICSSVHIHKLTDEAFYVLEGTFGFQVGEQTVEGSAGSCVFAPKGTKHARSEERRVGKECRSRWSPYH